MRLCRYWNPVSGPALGLERGSVVLDLTGADPESFGSFSSLIDSEGLQELIEAAASGSGLRPVAAWSDLDIPPDPRKPHLLAPVTGQEIWAAGVTYLRSREARMEESAEGGSFYDRVYHADRPELFFKATAHRVAGPNAAIRIRRDSTWNVPEPELALVLNRRGDLVGYTIGNDVSSRSIEGENPLYLPQAKVYMGSCALGPALVPAFAVSDIRQWTIRLEIEREGEKVFSGSTALSQMKRSLDDLVSYLFLEQDFPHGAVLLTGTGIVPPDEFTLLPKDVVSIAVPEIGILRNPVAA